MEVIRISTGPDGKSFFSDVKIELSDKGKFGWMSELYAAPGIIFRDMGTSYDSGWHTVPHPVILIFLKGSVEITVGTGEKRVFGPGSVLHAEDTTGTGHATRATGSERVESILVNLSASQA